MGYGWLVRQQIKLREKLEATGLDAAGPCKRISITFLIALGICAACMVTGYILLWPLPRTFETVSVLAGLMLVMLFVPAICVKVHVGRIMRNAPQANEHDDRQ